MADSAKAGASAVQRQAFWLNSLHTEPPAPAPPPGLQTRCIPSLLREVPPDTTRVWLMNFMVSPLLLREIAPVLFTLPLTIFHGEDLEREDWMPSHMHLIRPKTPYMGTHHTKGLLFFTPRGVRLCIHTANYIPGDLLLKTQGVWMQDFPRKQEAQLASSASNSFTSAAAAAAGAAAPSDFETALVNYFSHCCRGHEDQCGDPRTLLSAFDFRNARGALVGSVPGLRAGSQRSQFGHHRIRALLQREVAYEKKTLPSNRPISTADREDWPIVCQYSSCGSLASNWVRAELLKSMGAKHSTRVYHVVPTVEQVRLSIEGYRGGNSIPIASKNVFLQASGIRRQKRPFGSSSHGACACAAAAGFTRIPTIVPVLHDPPTSTLCRWGGRPMQQRTRGSLPHIKTYCRFRFVHGDVLHGHRSAMPKDSGGSVASSPTELAWVLLTSSNLSKAAHGFTMSKDVDGGKQKILSWELGVLLFPRHFAAKADSTEGDFSLTTTSTTSPQRQLWAAPTSSNAVLVAADGDPAIGSGDGSSHVVCPLPYELPPVPYTDTDELWTIDTPHIVPDLHGRVMCDDPNVLLALKRQRQAQQSSAGSWSDAPSTSTGRAQPATAPGRRTTAPPAGVPHVIELDHDGNRGSESVASSKFSGVGRKLGGARASGMPRRRGVGDTADQGQQQRNADHHQWSRRTSTSRSPVAQNWSSSPTASEASARSRRHGSDKAEDKVVIDLLSSSDDE